MKKTRFIVVLLGMLIPMTSFAGVPNADFMNLGTNLVENIQTVYSKIENGLQVTTLQSTMSKMGSAKSSVSGLFNKLKDVATKAKEKFDKYKGAIEKAAAMSAAIISVAKEIQEEGIGGYLKNNAGDLAGKVGLDGDKVQNAVNNVDNAVQGIKEGGLDGYLKENAGDLAGKVGLDGDKVQNAVNSVDNAVQGIKEGGLDGYLKDNAGDLAGKAGLDGDKVQNAVDGIDKATGAFKGNSTKGELQGSADASGVDVNKADDITGKGDLAKKDTLKKADIDAKTNTTTSVKDKLVDTPQTTPMKRSLEGFSGKTVSDDVLKTVEASKETAKVSKEDVKAVSTPSVEASKETAKVSKEDVKAVSAPSVEASKEAAKVSKEDVKAVSAPSVEASKETAKAASKEDIKAVSTPSVEASKEAAKAEAKASKEAAKAESKEAVKAVSTPSVEASKETAKVSKEAVKAVSTPSVEASKEIAKAASKASKEAAKASKVVSTPVVATPKGEVAKKVPASVTPIAEIKNVKIQSELKKASSVKAVAPQKAVKPEATIQNVVKPKEVIKDDSVSKKVDINDVKKVKASEKAVPKRVQFKSSFGYGKVQNKYQLGFASIDATTKIGETPEGVLVVPESVYLNCNLDYEAATSDKKMDTCLKKINDVVVSEVSEETPKGMIDDYARDIYNGYVEYLTATYFEALETYNDSLTFKNNEIDPIRTTSTSDVDGAWAVAKEMHMVLGSRFNKLRKLWARNLSMKMYSKYVNEKFTNDAK